MDSFTWYEYQLLCSLGAPFHELLAQAPVQLVYEGKELRGTHADPACKRLLWYLTVPSSTVLGLDGDTLDDQMRQRAVLAPCSCMAAEGSGHPFAGVELLIPPLQRLWGEALLPTPVSALRAEMSMSMLLRRVRALSLNADQAGFRLWSVWLMGLLVQSAEKVDLLRHRAAVESGITEPADGTLVLLDLRAVPWNVPKSLGRVAGAYPVVRRLPDTVVVRVPLGEPSCSQRDSAGAVQTLGAETPLNEAAWWLFEHLVAVHVAAGRAYDIARDAHARLDADAWVALRGLAVAGVPVNELVDMALAVSS